jgi:hypothetical protein
MRDRRVRDSLVAGAGTYTVRRKSGWQLQDNNFRLFAIVEATRLQGRAKHHAREKYVAETYPDYFEALPRGALIHTSSRKERLGYNPDSVYRQRRIAPSATWTDVVHLCARRAATGDTRQQLESRPHSRRAIYARRSSKKHDNAGGAPSVRSARWFLDLQLAPAWIEAALRQADAELESVRLQRWVVVVVPQGDRAEQVLPVA